MKGLRLFSGQQGSIGDDGVTQFNAMLFPMLKGFQHLFHGGPIEQGFTTKELDHHFAGPAL